jgi:hypothetical protein
MSDKLTFGDKEYSPDQAQALLDGLAMGSKHDTNEASPGAQVPHGLAFNQNLAGLLSRPGAEPGMFGTTIQPDGMWMSALMTAPSEIWIPEYDILTGVRDCDGDNATGFCGDAPTAGFGKLCTHSSRFGEFFMRTRQVEINKIGGRINRADMDKNLLNNPSVYPLMPDVVNRARNINTQLGMNIFTAGVTVHRWMARAIFHGVYGTGGANAYCGFIKEFDGFDRLIRTGYLDLDSGNHCSAADSKIIDWESTECCDALNGYTMVDLMSWLMNYLMTKADDQNITGTRWVLAMNPNLFNALVECWPCDYNTYGCDPNGSNNERNMSASELNMMRNAMKQGSYLLVNGMQFPVWKTSAIEQTAYDVGFRSQIYVIPLASMGIRTTYLEWFHQANSQIMEYIGQGNVHYSTMNNGLWAWTERQEGFCHEYYFGAQPRLVMRTPWLAARIENVVYQAPFDLYTDSPYPSEPYHHDGGRYYTSGAYYGGDWANVDQPLQR